MSIYGEHHRALQDQFETRPLADALEAGIVAGTIDDATKAFIESRAFFFLSTLQPSGHPTVSHKGGAPGFVRVVDERTIVFPSYDGNGMYLSMGNIAADGRIGMLFIDFETPNRIRVHADAVVRPEDPLLAEYPGAELIVRATVTEVFQNCPRYITKQTAATPSKYVPDEQGKAPVAAWKRIDALQPALPTRDQARVAAVGTITGEEYGRLFAEGDA